MNSKTLVSTGTSITLDGLLLALQAVKKLSPVIAQDIYLDMPVTVALTEETLSDGSKVYNLEITEQEG